MYKKERKKYLRSSHVDGKREIPCFHVETATGKREKWRENRGHVVIFAVRVSRCQMSLMSLASYADAFWAHVGKPEEPEGSSP